MNKLTTALLCAATVMLCACAGPSRAYKTQLQSYIAAKNFDGAAKAVEAAKEKEYSKKNSLLYYLDHGTVLHDGGKYRDSEYDFDTAERRMDELYTKSLHRAAGTFLINDNTTEYAGAPHERALLNVFRSLDYIFLGQLDDAAVEARKVTFYLDHLREARGPSFNYKDDAFAQYLSAMIFEDAGKADDARISLANAMKSYEDYAAHFATPVPADGPAKREYASKGEVVFLHYNGMAPAKVSRTFQVAWDRALLAVSQSNDSEAQGANYKNALLAGITGNAITVAYPEYEDMPFLIKSSEIEAGSSTVPTALVENISAIAKDELNNQVASQRLRMIARATIKFVLARYAQNTARQKSETLGFLTGLVANAVAAATEVADTRSWAALPAEIRMARVMLPPGKYDLKVNFKDSFGNITAGDILRDVVVVRGKRTYLHYRTAQ